MDFGELKLVLVLVVKNSAVLVDEAHDGRLPTWGPQKADDHVEEPVLQEGNH